ncbi:hypothetical protein GNE08_08700 [Trichormus variabilis ARAD]|uniref:Uncharacterized protein n=2 Tax=Anabaena variabilis TaxID=264691 RepID=A0ABR6SFQ5_ANAVA|nr:MULTISPECIES: hypothetical protein [Nostocaceae]MBC1214302.1 hypothetical protein [Trichormus variabilis ARAD]MBC1269471.1 hypothetical protein [Trichormus variabilis FSR]MBC1305094.1 hypothetical protein [Trichormus variabilis N2B]MBC1310985.1 hypothetical protein [Trichormus variabilis PNB]MBC1327335.1 hypothetical protein [Trichormus variabilis 9RC]
MIALLVTQVIDFSTYCAGLVNGQLPIVSGEAVRWGDSAVGGFADLKRLSSGSPTCSNCRSPEGLVVNRRNVVYKVCTLIPLLAPSEVPFTQFLMKETANRCVITVFLVFI